MHALLILDVQNDFMPNGSLAVPGSEAIIPVINQIQSYFNLIIATQDWHPANHQSFASQHPGKKPFDLINKQTLWPDHCVQGTKGAEFYPSLNTNKITTIFRKGTDSDKDSYSAFYDNDHKKNTGLASYLRDRGVRDLYFSGLCADICVYYSILDALNENFSCTLIEDATKALDSLAFEKIKQALKQKHVSFIMSHDLINIVYTKDRPPT